MGVKTDGPFEMSGAANFEWLPQMNFGCALSQILE